MPSTNESGWQTPHRLTARLLGPVSLEIDRREIANDRWPRREGRDLLFLLLATPGHRVLRDRVYDALWPDLAPDAARNAYYKALHSLRRALEPELSGRDPGSFVVANAAMIALDADASAVDVDTFEALLAQAQRADTEDKFVALQEAMALYRGDLLAEEPDCEWAAERRRSLQRAWQRAVLELATLEIARRRAADAIPRLDSLLAADPLSEEAHRLLILAYDQLGRRDLAQRQYEQCVATLRDELGVDPSPETRRVAAGLLDGARPHHAPKKRAAWAAVPAPPSRLIGRERALEEILDLVHQSDVRLVTLVGPGGVGKTRLVIEAATAVAPQFPDGVCYVSLAPVREPGRVAATIARAFGVREDPGRSPVAHVCDALRDCTALLVLDNFEHVRAAAPIVAELLAGAAGLNVLVTSREPLHLRAERLIDLPPLDVPVSSTGGTLPTLAALERAGAVTLFVERAAAVLPGFGLTPDNAAAVVAICGRLDGLPLAIELAAARTRELPPARLLRLLDRRLAVLVDGYQDLPPRQQTMRNAIAWSHDLLDPDPQWLCSCCFEGSPFFPEDARPRWRNGSPASRCQKSQRSWPRSWPRVCCVGK